MAAEGFWAFVGWTEVVQSIVFSLQEREKLYWGPSHRVLFEHSTHSHAMSVQERQRQSYCCSSKGSVLYKSKKSQSLTRSSPSLVITVGWLWRCGTSSSFNAGRGAALTCSHGSQGWCVWGEPDALQLQMLRPGHQKGSWPDEVALR